MCVYACACVSACLSTPMQVCDFCLFMCLFMCVCTRFFVWEYAHVCVCVCVCVRLHKMTNVKVALDASPRRGLALAGSNVCVVFVDYRAC